LSETSSKAQTLTVETQSRRARLLPASTRAQSCMSA